MESKFKKNFERIPKQCGFTNILPIRQKKLSVSWAAQNIAKLTMFAHKGYLSTFFVY